MAERIFVNYRRDDARDMAARIRDRLAATFGNASVFMDVDNLIAGQRFDEELEKALSETDVFLAVIGPRWAELLAERQGSGGRDHVREEIAGALQRGIAVIPVMVEQTPLPRADTLPEDIRNLVSYQKLAVTHERFGRDVEDLAKAIRLGRKAALAQNKGSRLWVRRIAMVAGLMAVLLGFGVLSYRMGLLGRGTDHRDADEAAGGTPPFFSCNSHAECQTGNLCVDNGGDGRFYCKPICDNDAMCQVYRYSVKCYPHKRADGTASGHRVCNDKPSYLR